jgi:hypothetical protein
MSAEGRSLELYFIEGRPDGMLTAEVFNWTGHVLMTPRTRLSKALVRQEASFTGVYLLLGEVDGEPRVYIGEGEDIGDRIRSHDIRKDWWTSAVLVTSAANNLNKAHVKYLEVRLVEEAKSVGKVTLDNGNTPPRPSLTEAAKSNMEAFLDYLFMVLPALRVDLFLQNRRPSVVSPSSDKSAEGVTRFHLSNRRHGITAEAILKDGEFIVQAGSKARLSWEGQGTKQSGYAVLHEELSKSGILKPDGPCSVFMQSYAFSSPSAAAAVVNGRPANGTIEWRLENGLSYKEWEAEQLQTTGTKK